MPEARPLFAERQKQTQVHTNQAKLEHGKSQIRLVTDRGSNAHQT
jgi:hypothetical protein